MLHPMHSDGTKAKYYFPGVCVCVCWYAEHNLISYLELDILDINFKFKKTFTIFYFNSPILGKRFHVYVESESIFSYTAKENN